MSEALVDPGMALITGASGEIGGAVALRLVEQGFYVHGVSSSEKGAKAFQNTIGGSKNGIGHALDLANLNSVNEWCRDTFTGAAPGVVVHAAGVTRDELLFSTEEFGPEHIQDYVDVMAINALAPLVIERNLAVRRRRAGGHVLFVSSIAPHIGTTSQAKYAMTKGAVEALEHVEANEVAGKKGHINAIAYGPVNTRMWLAVDPKHRAKAEEKMILNNGQAFSVVQAADAAMEILTGAHQDANGCTFVLDGGLLAGENIASSRFVQLG